MLYTETVEVKHRQTRSDVYTETVEVKDRQTRSDIYFNLGLSRINQKTSPFTKLGHHGED